MTGCGCIATVLHFVYFLTVRSHKHYSNKTLLYKIVTLNIEALPEVLGNRGTRAYISGGTREKMYKNEGNGNKGNFGEQST